MKEFKRAERIVIALTLLCIFFTAGYFVGRQSSVGFVTLERLPQTTTASAGNAAGTSPSGVSGVSEMSDTGTTVSEITNINTAAAEELEKLPGIGDIIAQNIITYRREHGNFKTIYELTDISGIGTVKFDAIKDMITVG